MRWSRCFTGDVFVVGWFSDLCDKNSGFYFGELREQSEVVDLRFGGCSEDRWATLGNGHLDWEIAVYGIQ